MEGWTICLLFSDFPYYKIKSITLVIIVISTVQNPLSKLSSVGRGGMDWEFAIDIYILLILCIKYIANESILNSTGNSTQYSVVT